MVTKTAKEENFLCNMIAANVLQKTGHVKKNLQQSFSTSVSCRRGKNKTKTRERFFPKGEDRRGVILSAGL